MHLTRRTFVSGAVATAVLPLPLAAQSDSEEVASSELLKQIPGLKTAYARRYDRADSHAHIEIGDAEIEVSEETPNHLVINALDFDSAAQLTGILGMMLNTDTAGLLISDQDIELTEEPAGDFPRGSTFFYGEAEDGEYKSLLVIPVDNIGFAITARGDSDAVQVTADAIGAFLVEQEPSVTPVVVVSEGVAEGGVFDVFPGLDELDVLNGLIPMYDYDLLVSESPILPANATATPT